MDWKNYQLSEYEEYLLKRTGAENVSFIDGMVYATYHQENSTVDLMKTNDDEFVALCIEAENQMKPLQINNADDNFEWMNCIRFPIDSADVDGFEKVFYEQHPDIEPQQKNNPLSGSVVTVPLGEALFEFMYADFDSLYDEVKFRLYKYDEIELPNVESDIQENINHFLSYRAYEGLINCLAFGSTASAFFPPSINDDADISEAIYDYYQYLKMLQQEYKEFLEFCFDSKYYSEVLGDMTPAVRYYLYRKINKLPPFVEFNEERRLLMDDRKKPSDYDTLAFAEFARENNIDAYTLMYFHNYNHKPVIRYRCESLHEFLELEFNKLIEYGVKLKRCERCGQFFSVKGNYDARYCNRIHSGEVRSCRDLAAEENYKMKMAENKAIPIYRKYYRRYSARVKVHQIKEPDFKKWKYAALTKRDDCSNGKITVEQYIEWNESYFPNRKRKDKQTKH
ncbi:MAG: hypothetical protein IJV39_00210 [Ruminococcus sp.]|nr:hypothetical protein [Ruminococcus sp.]